ncbi:hypothetical protein GGR52DRAFT_231818 [Hypoxylon sp. FL1284]|nr:hypothetical protein GGR52DRAFT_231818 [Hypoxylon sp. FL1284]
MLLLSFISLSLSTLPSPSLSPSDLIRLETRPVLNLCIEVHGQASVSRYHYVLYLSYDTSSFGMLNLRFIL